MSASTQLQARSGTIEFVLCIEGVGWLADESTGPSGGFSGALFVTSGTEGELAGGASMHAGLLLPTSIEESIDPDTGKHEISGMNFEIVDVESILAARLPSLTPNEGALNADLSWGTTTVVIKDYEFAAGAVVWIAGREAVLLGTKSGAGPWTYTGSTRGYLGTPQGRYDAWGIIRASTGTYGFPWNEDDLVQSRRPTWHDLRVRLYAHVPTEAASQVLLLYSGRITGLTYDAGATAFRIDTSARSLEPAAGGLIRRPDSVGFTFHGFSSATAVADLFGGNFPSGIEYADGGYEINGMSSEEIGAMSISQYLVPYGSLVSMGSLAEAGGQSTRERDMWLFSCIYNYRAQAGGTYNGMVFPPTTPQAPSFGAYTYASEAYLWLDGVVLRIIGAAENAADALILNGGTVALDWYSVFGSKTDWDTSEYPIKCRPLLDNLTDDPKLSRWYINGRVMRHPIEVMLCFMLSMNNEFFVGDAVTGSTTTVIQFSGPSWTSNQWAGYALFAVEDSNKYEARTIVSNTADTITVDWAFSNTPTNAKEYQVRNSIYDILPLGWGLQIPHTRVDVSSFESVRDSYLAGAEVGKFFLGAETQIAIWDMLMTHIAEPYALLVYTDRTTGAVSCRYLGEAFDDGVLETWGTLAEADFIEVGDIDGNVSMPIGSIAVTVRNSVSVAYHLERTWVSGYGPAATDRAFSGQAAIGGETTELTFSAPEYWSSWEENSIGAKEFQALFNSIEDCDILSAIQISRLRRMTSPPPLLSCKVGMHKAESLQAGFFVSITHSNVFDPISGSVGMSSRAGRIVSTRIDFSEDNPGVDLVIELLTDRTGCRIAPAGLIHAKSSDGNGNYIEIDIDTFTNDPGTEASLDHQKFQVGDKIYHYTTAGVPTTDLGAITGFGSNFVADPADASYTTVCRIYYDGSVPGSITADSDYVSFKDWGAGNTARMELYSAYASAAEVFGDSDAGKEYG